MIWSADKVCHGQAPTTWRKFGLGSPGDTTRLGTLRPRASARETLAFVEKLRGDLREAQRMLEVG